MTTKVDANNTPDKNPKKPPVVSPPSSRPISIDREERPLVGNPTSKL